MGISFSCPFSQYSDVENALESVIVKSISLGEDEVKTLVHTVSFNRCDQELMVLKSLGSGKMMLETSVSFKGRDLEEMVLVKAPSFDGGENLAIQPIRPNKKEMDNQLENIDSPVDTKTIQSLVILDPTIPKHMAALKLQKVYKSKEMDNQLEKIDSPVDTKMIQSLVISDPTIPKHMAALKLQKVYKSFRTRRRLADCAVLVEQSWWKLLDFAELKRSSISFFEIEKHETAISRWSRARTRAAKVGKGLSKNDRAQKLALRHWLEAIDPRHRYGHNLHFYYVKWLHCQSKEPFFYWLDIGEGKEVNQVDKCPRSRLQQQCIKYLGPKERMAYEAGVEKGTFFYKQSGEILHTAGEGEDDKWIFVLSTSKVLYVGKKKKGKFQHSSFLAGGATTAAGRLVVENGILKALWPHSGHYRPTEENFKDFVSFLRENNVNVSDVQMNPIDEEADSISKQRSSLQNNSSKGDLIHERSDSMQDVTTELEACKPKQINLGKKLSDIEIPRREILFNRLESEDIRAAKSGWNGYNVESLVDGNEMAEEEIGSEQGYMIPKKNLFDENVEESKECEIISEESILKRINSHKGINSFQLGKQLTCKWTTGAGPRIGCVRDYPSKLQSFALEQVSLSPKSAVRSKSYFSPKRMGSGLSPKVLTPKPAIKTPCTIDKWKSLSSKSVQHFRTLSLPLLTGTPVVANMS